MLIESRTPEARYSSIAISKLVIVDVVPIPCCMHLYLSSCRQFLVEVSAEE